MSTAVAIGAPQSSLAQHWWTLRFLQKVDEDAFVRSRWSRDLGRARVTVGVVAALALTLTLDNDRTDYSRTHTQLAVLFLCRVVPVAVLAVCAGLGARPWVARWWSPLSSACALLLVLSVFLHQFLCASDAGSPRSCGWLGGGQLLPWVPLAWVALHPLVLAYGLCAVWYDVLWSGVASLALLGGLVLSGGSGDSLATAVVLAVATLTVATVASYTQDAERREAFRRNAVSQRETASVVERLVERSVSQEMYQKLADGIKRSGLMVSEVAQGGTVNWVSPGCRPLLGVLPADLVHTDTFRWVHPSDAGVVQDAIQSCMGVTADGRRLEATDATWGLCRLQFRRLRGDGTFVWVQAEVHPVAVRRPAAPASAAVAGRGAGSRAAAPAAPLPSVLMVECDLTAERERARANGRDVARQAFVLPVALAASSGGAASTGSAAAAAVPVSPVSPAAAPGAPFSGTGQPVAAAQAYDPFYERTLFTAVASLRLPFASIAAAMRALLQQLAAAAPPDTARTHPAMGTTASAALSMSNISTALASSERGSSAAMRTGSSSSSGVSMAADLGAVESTASIYQLALDDALGVARLHCGYLPLRDGIGDGSASIRDLVQDSAQFTRLRLALEGYSPSKLTTFVGPNVPERVAADPVRIRTLTDLLLGASAAIAIEAPDDTDDVLLSVYPSSSASGGSFLQFYVSVDARRVGGTPAIKAALNRDPLAVRAVFSPLAHDELLPASVDVTSVSQSALSFQALLPLLRHVVLCMGGTVSSYDPSTDREATTADASYATYESATGASSSGDDRGGYTIIAVDFPVSGVVRPLMAGPTLPHPRAALAAIAAAPCDIVPAGDPVRGYSGSVPTDGSGESGSARAYSTGAAAGAALGPRYVGADTPVITMPPAPAAAAAARSAAAAAATAAAEGEQPVGAAAVPQQQQSTAAGVAAAAATHAEPSSVSLGLNVLYVDDELINRRMGAKILARLGCSYALLEDGDQVLPQLLLPPPPGGKPFNAILMDILMERSDGEAVCRQLRAAGVTLPIAAVTGDTSDTQRFFAAGFDFVLEKPFRLQDALRVLVDGQALFAARAAAAHED